MMNDEAKVDCPRSSSFSIHRSAFRRAVDLIVLAVIAVLVVLTWQVEWFYIPTSSMAPTLRGMHATAHCEACGFDYAVGLDGSHDPQDQVVCPNCDQLGMPLGDLPEIAGDRILVDKSAFAFRNPRRWEVIAYRSPAHPQQVMIKRVVGLPGETIQIRSGDVYADGVLQRKSLAEQRALARLVYDADHPPPPATGIAPPWRSQQAYSHWRDDGSGVYTCQALDTPGELDWLAYHHLPKPYELKESTAGIVDDDAYNQGQPTLSHYRVDDLLLTCRVRVTAAGTSGRLAIRASAGSPAFTATLDFARRWIEVSSLGQTVAKAPLDEACVTHDFELTASLVDRQFLIAIDGVTVVTHPYDRAETASSGDLPAWAIGVGGLDVQLSHLRVYRDVYYTPIGPGWSSAGIDEPYRLGPDEFFVLGDNSPRSIDSRYASTGPGVAANLLVGKPFLVHYPSRRTSLGVGSFQVPDFARIGYIR